MKQFLLFIWIKRNIQEKTIEILEGKHKYSSTQNVSILDIHKLSSA